MQLCFVRRVIFVADIQRRAARRLRHRGHVTVALNALSSGIDIPNMARLSAMRALLLLSALSAVQACGWARSGLPLPAGHAPSVGGLPYGYAPGVPFFGANGSGVQTPALLLNPALLARVANASASYSRDMCLWTQQVMTPPPAGWVANDTCVPGPCNDFTHPSLSDLAELLAISTESSAMWAKLTAPLAGVVFLGSTCSGGSIARRVACASWPFDPHCNETFLNQTSPYSVGSHVFRVTPDTLPLLQQNLSVWLQWPKGDAPCCPIFHPEKPCNCSGAWHGPAQSVSLIRGRGWALWGANTAKVVPCDAIPLRFRDATFAECDAMGEARALYDEGREEWDRACQPAGFSPGCTI